MKQAEGASNAAKNLIKSDSDSKDKKLTSGTDVLDELKKTKADRDAMKAQAEGLQKEYDRVCEELNSVPSFFFFTQNMSNFSFCKKVTRRTTNEEPTNTAAYFFLGISHQWIIDIWIIDICSIIGIAS